MNQLLYQQKIINKNLLDPQTLICQDLKINPVNVATLIL